MTKTSSPFYTEDHESYRDVVRQFTEKEITPNVHEWDLAGEVPRDLYNKAGAIGLFGDGFDAEYGGHGQRDALMRLVLMWELCMSGSGGVVAALFSNYIGLPPVQRFASDEVKAEVIAPSQSGEAIAALAITEPSGGSDVARIKTTAKLDGDHYVVNGSKTFITSGMRADYFTAAVRTGGEGPAGISMLVIPGDLPGIDRTKLDKMGWLASDTATLYFDDVRVPAKYLLGEENAGFSMIVNNFNAERMDLAVQSIAFARVCYNEALAWARERETFGIRATIRWRRSQRPRLVQPSPLKCVPGKRRRFSVAQATSAVTRSSGCTERSGSRPSVVARKRSCGTLRPGSSVSERYPTTAVSGW